MIYILIYAACIMSCSSFLSAVDDNNNRSNAVTVTAPDYTYDLNFTTLFLKTSSDIAYAAETFTLPLYSPSWQTFNIATNYHFAFDLGAKIVLHEKNSALKGNWEHFKASDRSRHNVALNSDIIGAYSGVSDASEPFQQAQGSLDYQRDKLAITYGQLISIGKDLSVHLFAGVSFARLRQNLLQLYQTNDHATIRMIDTTNSFSGVGPEIGVDLFYHIHKGLNFSFHQTIDFLTGTTKSNTNFASVSPESAGLGVQNPNLQSLTTPGRFEVAPVFTQKIGLNYELLFRNHCAYALEIGYQSQIFLNMFYSNAIASQASVSTVGVFAKTIRSTPSNFTLSGPYFRCDIAF